jgi:hypothetical protein
MLGVSNPALTMINEGFAGMGVRAVETDRFSVFARSARPAPQAARAQLVSAFGRQLGSGTVMTVLRVKATPGS